VPGDLQIRVFHLGQPQQDGRVDQWQQVIDLEAEVVGQLGQAIAPAARGEDLQQPGQPAGRHPRQRHVRRSEPRPGSRRSNGLGDRLLPPGQDAVHGVHELLEPRFAPVSRPV
jgi:hypothetical protein